MRRKIISAFIMVLLIAIVAIPNMANAAEPVLKVKLKNYLGNQTSITLVPSGNYTTADNKVTLNSGVTYSLKLESSTLKLYNGSTKLAEYSSFSLLPSNSENNNLSINGRKYAGSFEFVKEIVNSKEYIRPINSISMEKYLKGVLPAEVYPSWNKEALKSQAVAARTYALSYGSSVIDDTIQYQAYWGLQGYASTDTAVKDTEGQVLKYNGNLINAVFSASNGGKTESNQNAWGSTALPYYVIKTDSFDPETAWGFSVKKKQIDMTDKDLTQPDEWWNSTTEQDTTIVKNIKTWLDSNGYEDKDIKVVSVPTLTLSNPTSGGRMSKGSFKVQFYVKDMKDTNGSLILQKKELIDVAATRIRPIIGNLIIKSYLVDNIENTSTSISISGKGNGHGVGLSQWGAQYRAVAGHSYNDILSFYYPGTALITQYKIDETAPVIKDVATSYDARTNHLKVDFHINETANTTVNIKNSNGQIVKTMVNNQTLNAGAQSFSWDVLTLGYGQYSVEITSTDKSGNKSASNLDFYLNKQFTPVIKNFNANYFPKSVRMSLSFYVDQNTTTTVRVKNSDNKTIKMLANNEFRPYGTKSYIWDVSNVRNGTYILQVSSINSSGKKKTVKFEFKVNKPIQTAVVNVPSLNIREQTSISSKVVGTVTMGKTVTILSKHVSWYKIKYGTTVGFVKGIYLTNFKTL